MSPLASCSACVDACPENAWFDGDDGLCLDTERCDGCGLCVPACPQKAIEIAAGPSLRLHRRSLAALAICARSARPGDPGQLPCLHMMGWRQLLELRDKGVVRLHVMDDDCDRCHVGSKRSAGNRTLDEHHALASRLWQDRGIEPMAMVRHDRASYRRLVRDSEPFEGRAFSRRRFFRAFADEPEAAVARRGRLQAHVPYIDEALCRGCDICARLCPTGALTISDDENEPAYRVDAAACSGCGLCVDVCDAAAVSVDSWTRAEQIEMRLAGVTCPSCKVPFHRPASQASEDSLCDICRVKGRRSIYPVLVE